MRQPFTERKASGRATLPTRQHASSAETLKLRILDNSVRLRVDRQEVDCLGAGGTIDCTTHFPGGAHLDYTLGPGGDAVTAEFTGATLGVTVPATELADWAADPSRVGILGKMPLVHGMLTVLIEKDFECLDPRLDENQANRFPNPKAEG